MKLICVLCPQGCEIYLGDKGDIRGNRCPRGAVYALEEKESPKRTLTTTLAVQGGNRKRVSVKTKDRILLSNQQEILACLENISVKAPLQVGDLLSDPGNCSVDFLVTCEVKKV